MVRNRDIHYSSSGYTVEYIVPNQNQTYCFEAFLKKVCYDDFEFIVTIDECSEAYGIKLCYHLMKLI